MLHGKGHVWKEPFNHYHDSFQPGENTLNAQIARVLMRNMTANGRYDHETWFQRFFSPKKKWGKMEPNWMRFFFEMGWLKNNNLGNVSPGLQGLFDDCWQS